MVSGTSEDELDFELLKGFQESDNETVDTERDDDDNDISNDISNNTSTDGILGKVSKKVDLFFSADGKTLPRVSMLTNIAYTIPAHIIMVIANLVISKMFETSDYYHNRHTFRLKLWIRLSVVASIYILYAIYLLGVKKIPSGMMLAVGGVHAFLMNRAIYEFWPAWIVASLWAFGAGCFLYVEGKTTTTTATFKRDICVWALYSNLFVLSLPNITGFGGIHDPALLARSALLLCGYALGHPTLKLFGFVAVLGMLHEFLFPYGGDNFYDVVTDFLFQCLPRKNYN